jgi:hypothetical protein
MKWLIRVTAWERVSRRRRLVCALGRVAVLVILVIVLISTLGPPVAIYFTARGIAKRVPAVKVTPQPLTDYSVSDTAGTALSLFGYSFEVPWSASFKTKVSQKDSTQNGFAQITFDSGQVLLLFAPSNPSGLFTELVQDKELQMGNLRPVFGDLMNRTAYDQYSALLNTTPSTIRAFGPRAEAARGITMLMIKAIAPPVSLEKGAFSFEFPDKRGFQLGDPRKSQQVDLEVLDLNGHYVEIICAAAKDSRLTQPELNRILKTLHAVPPDSLAAQATRPNTPRN